MEDGERPMYERMASGGNKGGDGCRGRNGVEAIRAETHGRTEKKGTKTKTIRGNIKDPKYRKYMVGVNSDMLILSTFTCSMGYWGPAGARYSNM